MNIHTPIRIGLLSTARIANAALIQPARLIPEVTVAAVAARDENRARHFAHRRGIPRVHRSYADLIADPEIDAIYNPLPNSLHCEWSIRALEAGKHVLCEKPLASNAEEVRQMMAAASKSGRVLAEAFHTLYHPLAAQMKAIIDEGALGQIIDAEAHFCTMLLRPSDIRYQYELAGGATMDLGCYTLHLLRYLLDATPQVVSARATLASPQIDRSMDVQLLFPGSIPARMTCSLLSTRLFRISVSIRGDRGRMHVVNPLMPHYGYWLHVRDDNGRTKQKQWNAPWPRSRGTYWYQLRAFSTAIVDDEPMFTDGAYGLTNMQLIDTIYKKAGLEQR